MRVTVPNIPLFPFILLAFCSMSRATGDDIPTELSDIRVAWERRASQVHSLRITWEAQKSQNAESLSGANHLVTLRIPSVALFVSGNKIRYETALIDPAQDARGSAVSGTYSSTFDGDLSMDLRMPATGQFPQGILHASANYNDVDNLNFRAPMLAFWASKPELVGIDYTKYKMSDERPFLNGRECILLRTERNAEVRGIVRSLWVDPSMDYAIVRFDETSNGRLFARLDITYTSDNGTVVPSDWKLRFLGAKGTLIESADATVIDCSINEEISPDVFVIKFPVGTFVEDRRAQEAYIVTESGKRVVTADERARHASYDDLLSTPTGTAGMPGGSSYRMALIAGNAFVVALIAAYLLYVRRVRSS